MSARQSRGPIFGLNRGFIRWSFLASDHPGSRRAETHCSGFRCEVRTQPVTHLQSAGGSPPSPRVCLTSSLGIYLEGSEGCAFVKCPPLLCPVPLYPPTRTSSLNRGSFTSQQFATNTFPSFILGLPHCPRLTPRLPVRPLFPAGVQMPADSSDRYF